MIFTSSKELAKHYDFLKDNQVLICLYDCTIGVVDEGIKGYTKTFDSLGTENYNEAKKIVMDANKILHYPCSDLNIMKIILSSF